MQLIKKNTFNIRSSIICISILLLSIHLWGQQIDVEGIPLQHSVVVTNSGLAGVVIDTTARAGIELRNIGTDGLVADQVIGNGIFISNTGSNGALIQAAGQHGFVASSSNQFGFRSANSGDAGFAAIEESRGFYALKSDTGFFAKEANDIGFYSSNALNAGFHSDSSEAFGFLASKSELVNFNSLHAGTYGFHSFASGEDGFRSLYSNASGFNAMFSTGYGYTSSSNSQGGFYADEQGTGFQARKGFVGFRSDSAKTYGFYSFRSEGDGFNSNGATDNGFDSFSAGRNGFASIAPDENGFYALNAADAGFYSKGSSQDGFYSDVAFRYGMYLNDSGKDGVYVTNTTDRGVVSLSSGEEAGYFTNKSTATEAAVYMAHGDDSKYDLFLGSHGRIASNGSVHVYLDDNDNATLDRFYIKNSSGTNVALFSESGNADVLGNLSKGGGSFKIDHPLDPENKYLFHSFVESPDMMNVYNGNIKLDENGGAKVKLPSYFQALNRDFRYQLTAIGAPGPNLYISKEVDNLTFSIAGGSPNSKVSWQITGIRQDPFANENRIEVEVEKKAAERGRYLHEDAWQADVKKVLK